jgi:hypothetical protein
MSENVNHLGQPMGFAVPVWSARPRPPRTAMQGRFCRVVSLEPAKRLGFQFEGIFRQAHVIKGRNRDTAWFTIIDREWPQMKAAFEARLAPENFDLKGAQRQSLTQMRSRLL